MALTESHQVFKMRIGASIRCSPPPPNSRTKSPQELIQESNLVVVLNVNSFSLRFRSVHPWSNLVHFKHDFLYKE
jgi:hypothetical protein